MVHTAASLFVEICAGIIGGAIGVLILRFIMAIGEWASIVLLGPPLLFVFY
jgi:hypothetical protein